jgi:hypothetical protein
MMDQVELAVEAADFTLIPVLASAFDLMAALCRGRANRTDPPSGARHRCAVRRAQAGIRLRA